MAIEIIPDAGHGPLRMDEANPTNPILPLTISQDFFAASEHWLRANCILSQN